MYVVKDDCVRSSPHSQDPDQAPKHGAEVMTLPNQIIGKNTAMSSWVYFLETVEARCPQSFVNTPRK